MAEASVSGPSTPGLLCAALPSGFAWRALQLARAPACSNRCIVWRQRACMEWSTLTAVQSGVQHFTLSHAQRRAEPLVSVDMTTDVIHWVSW